MLTLHGIALLAELFAAASLAIALAGFAKWRDTPWLVCCGAAILAMIVAALVVIEAST
jgi:hypothetical protein